MSSNSAFVGYALIDDWPFGTETAVTSHDKKIRDPHYRPPLSRRIKRSAQERLVRALDTVVDDLFAWIIKGTLVVTLGVIAIALGVNLFGKRTESDVSAPAVLVTSNQDEVDLEGANVGAMYVLEDLFPKQISAPPNDATSSCTGRFDWALDQNGVVSDKQRLRVSVGLGSLETLTVNGYEVILDDGSGEPVAGSEVLCSGGGGGAVPLPTLQVDLNRSGSNGQLVSSSGKPADFYFEVQKDSPAVFDVEAVPIDCDCRWSLRLRTIENGESHIRFVTNKGEPFRVTSSEEAIGVGWDVPRQEWLPTGQVSSPVIVGSPPSTTRSACVDTRKEVQRIIPQGASFGTASADFEPLQDPLGSGERTGYVSTCSWAYGYEDESGTRNGLTLEDARLFNEDRAREFYNFLKENASPAGWVVRDGFEQTPDEKTAVSIDGSRVVFVSVIRQPLVVVPKVISAVLERRN